MFKKKDKKEEVAKTERIYYTRIKHENIEAIERLSAMYNALPPDDRMREVFARSMEELTKDIVHFDSVEVEKELVNLMKVANNGVV